MKKLVSVIVISAVVVLAAACAKKEAAPETGAPAAAETKPAETKPAETVGMPNPMVEITDSSEFEKQLGIKIDASKLHTPPKMYIIDGKVADVIMTMTNVNDEQVEYRLRATKDAELAPMMHGIYDELTPVGVIDMEFGSRKVSIDQKETKDKKISVHTWQVDDVYYSLVIDNSYSQMQYAEVMDSIFAAIGVEQQDVSGSDGAAGGKTDAASSEAGSGTAGRTAEVAPNGTAASYQGETAASRENADSSQNGADEIPYLEDGTIRVGVRADDEFNSKSDGIVIKCELYTMAVLDEAEVNGLKKGGILDLSKYGHGEVEIEKIEKKSNGAFEVNDIYMIEKNEGLGGYTIRGYDDDMVKYVSAYRLVKVTGDTVIDDQMAAIVDPQNPCSTVTDAMNRYNLFEATVEVKDGTAKKITIHYHP